MLTRRSLFALAASALVARWLPWGDRPRYVGGQERMIRAALKHPECVVPFGRRMGKTNWRPALIWMSLDEALRYGGSHEL